MNKFVRIALLSVMIFWIIPFVRPIHAEYVLPYPAFMPGNRIYVITRLVDSLQYYWHFGSIARFKYHLQLSDKYLVEAKTLFEYKQYLLASDALNRSDLHFSEIAPEIKNAQKKGIDASLLLTTYEAAKAKHSELLSGLLQIVPEQFIWSPEKDKPTNLHLNETLNKSLQLRKQDIWK